MRSSSAQLEKFCEIEPQAETLLRSAYEKLNLSARSYTRVMLTARTIALILKAAGPFRLHIAEAIQYRTLDRKYWGNVYD